MDTLSCTLCSVRSVEDSITLVNCLHVVCRPCLSGSLERQDSFQCPVMGCLAELLDEEVALVLEDTWREKEGTDEKVVTGAVVAHKEVENGDAAGEEAIDVSKLEILGWGLKCACCREPSNDVMVLEKCLHMLCRSCVKTRLIIEEGVDVRCPMKGVSGCDGVLVQHEIRHVATKEEFDRWLDRSINAARKDLNVVHCATPGCNGWYDVEKGRKFFHCSLCNMQNCLRCKAVHDDFTCEKYEEILTISAVLGRNMEELMNDERKSGWMQLSQLVKTRGVEVLDSDVIVTIHEIDCGICLSSIPPGEGVILHDCLHTYCRTCLAHVIRNSEESEVKCPFIDGNHSCQNLMKPRELKALVPQQDIDRLLTKATLVAEGVTPNSFHCLTPDCPGWYEVASDQVTTFRCFVCDKNNCISCKILHDGSCADYKRIVELNNNAEELSSNAVKELIRSRKAMRCPKCSRLIMKNGGCNHMKCAVCKHDFNWLGKRRRE